MIYLLLVVLVVLFNIAASNGSNCPHQQWIKESLEKVHIPGAAIVVVNATHSLYEQAFGYQSLLPEQPIDIDKSIFPLGSISKTFIATAVMQLVEQELVDLDTDVNRYLSEPQRPIFHPRYPSHAMTLRRLLSHSASTYVNLQVQNTNYQSGDDAFNESLADLCFKYVNPNTSNWLPKPPGTVTSYSNVGAALAALVVERVAKMPYIDYVEEKILKPLGVDITKTGVRLADFANIEDLVKHYVYVFNRTYVEEWNKAIPQLNFTQMPGNLPTWLYISHFDFSSYPSGLLRMSARALSVYLQMFLNNGSNILHPRSIAEMRTVVGGGLIPPYNQDLSTNSTGQRPTAQFGLSWYWDTMSNGRRYIGHGGSVPGIVTLMLVNEKNNMGVIVLSNGDVIAPTDLSREILETLENIHMSLFDCFDTDLTHSSTFGIKATLAGFFPAILLLFRFWLV